MDFNDGIDEIIIRMLKVEEPFVDSLPEVFEVDYEGKGSLV